MEVATASCLLSCRRLALSVEIICVRVRVRVRVEVRVGVRVGVRFGVTFGVGVRVRFNTDLLIDHAEQRLL